MDWSSLNYINFKQSCCKKLVGTHLMNEIKLCVVIKRFIVFTHTIFFIAFTEPSITIDAITWTHEGLEVQPKIHNFDQPDLVKIKYECGGEQLAANTDAQKQTVHSHLLSYSYLDRRHVLKNIKRQGILTATATAKDNQEKTATCEKVLPPYSGKIAIDETLKVHSPIFKKFVFLFHLKDHHTKDVNLKFWLYWSSHLDVYRKQDCILQLPIWLRKFNYGKRN